jgi:hypothetical protein
MERQHGIRLPHKKDKKYYIDQENNEHEVDYSTTQVMEKISEVGLGVGGLAIAYAFPAGTAVVSTLSIATVVGLSYCDKVLHLFD